MRCRDDFRTYVVIALDLILALVALVVLLGASELMVNRISVVGDRLGVLPGHLGFLLALGADSPEIATALIALITGSSAIGVGVVEGSNIYNLAGLLGLSAMIFGPIAISRRQVLTAGSANLVLVTLVALLILWSSLQPVRVGFGLLAVGATVTYFILQRPGGGGVRKPGSVRNPILISILASITLIAASALLVREVESLVSETGMAVKYVSILALPVVTSLPNTWAAFRMAMRGAGETVLSTAFNSNLINLSLGVGLPSIFTTLSPGRYAVFFDGPYLFAMTGLAVVLLFTSQRLSRLEGGIIVMAYGAYLAIRLSVL